MDPDRLFEIALSTIEGVPFCFLITVDESGQAHARLMEPFGPQKDLVIWFGTSPRTRKVRDIRRDSRVAVAYENVGESAYVTLLGTAQLIDDLDLRYRYWRDGPVWNAIWPAGPEGDDYMLIRFVPTRIEVMSGANDVFPNPYGLRPAVLVRKGDAWAVAGDEW